MKNGEPKHGQLDDLVKGVHMEDVPVGEQSRRKAVSTRTEPGDADALSGRWESERLENQWLHGRRGHHA